MLESAKQILNGVEDLFVGKGTVEIYKAPSRYTSSDYGYLNYWINIPVAPKAEFTSLEDINAYSENLRNFLAGKFLGSTVKIKPANAYWGDSSYIILPMGSADILVDGEEIKYWPVNIRVAEKLGKMETTKIEKAKFLYPNRDSPTFMELNLEEHETVLHEEKQETPLIGVLNLAVYTTPELVTSGCVEGVITLKRDDVSIKTNFRALLDSESRRRARLMQSK